ncbi:helix-turn-helix domain-containing protein [Hominisplanchenecus murintestinalis]|uniref:helix-turn-helix domain-containing protein n=1 Tax=Hominisplanchenecus murintestinalis TaxID=2941517 RepID=UPI0020424F0D|nr:helix-turn-helix transcriptional regulator [Hominisplanchenecus murintestinalis]
MKDRIKQIRKHHKLTQVEFGERIGVKGNTVTGYETGLRNPTDAIILSICREFGVNEEWLRTGRGEPTIEASREERFSINIGKLQRTDNETLIRWVNMIAETNPEILVEIEGFIKKLLKIEEEPG